MGELEVSSEIINSRGSRPPRAMFCRALVLTNSPAIGGLRKPTLFPCFSRIRERTSAETKLSTLVSLGSSMPTWVLFSINSIAFCVSIPGATTSTGSRFLGVWLKTYDLS